MYPELRDLNRCKDELYGFKELNCVEASRLAKKFLKALDWPEEKLFFLNCKTENKEHHRVLVVNHEGYQYMIDNRYPTSIILDDCIYTDWYGGKELT